MEIVLRAELIVSMLLNAAAIAWIGWNVVKAYMR